MVLLTHMESHQSLFKSVSSWEVINGADRIRLNDVCFTFFLAVHLSPYFLKPISIMLFKRTGLAHFLGYVPSGSFPSFSKPRPLHGLFCYHIFMHLSPRCRARLEAGAFSVAPVSTSNQPWGHGLRQQSLCP